MEKGGKKVSKPMVYQILAKTKNDKKGPKAAPKKRGPKPGTKAKKNAKKRGPKPGSSRVKAATTVTSSNEDLFAAMQNFVNAAGSLEKAIEILSVFKR